MGCGASHEILAPAPAPPAPRWKEPASLHEAISLGDVGAVRRMLESGKCSLDAVDDQDRTPLQLANQQWAVSLSECTGTLWGHTDRLEGVTISPDGKTIVSGSGDMTVRVWDLMTDKCKNTLKGHTHDVYSVAISPDGKTIVSGSGDNTIRVWDAATGKCKNTLEGHANSILSLRISPDGKTIVSGLGDKTIRVWDLMSGQCKSTLEGHTGCVYSVAISPDGKTIVSGSGDKTIRVWDLMTGKCKNTLKGHTYTVYSVAISPDGKTIVSGSTDKTIRVWDLKSGDCKSTLQGHTRAVASVAISPDGKTIVSGSWDNTIRVWDLMSGQCKSTLEGHTNAVYSVAISPDGKTIVSGSGDNTIRLWHSEGSEVLELVQAAEHAFHAKEELRAFADELSGFVRLRDLKGFVAFTSQHQKQLNIIINTLGTDGKACLHHTVFSKAQQFTQIVCRMEAVNASVRDKDGLTPLTLALDAGDIGLSQVLLAAGAQVNTADNSREPLLVRQARQRNVPAVQVLVTESAELDAQDAQGVSALLSASQEPADEALIGLLLQSGAPPDQQDKAGRTPLGLAVARGSDASVQQLLEHGAKPSILHMGCPPLSMAVEAGHLGIAHTLLEYSALPDADQAGRTPLGLAVTQGSEAGVQLLLEYGASPNLPHVKCGPLYMAVEAGHLGIARKLLEYSATPDLDQGGVPLVLAVQRKQLDAARLLLEFGASPNVLKQGDHLLLVAVKGKDAPMVDLLLQFKADVTCQDNEGLTPLHHATLEVDAAMVELLLAAGADPEKANQTGLTPFLLAEDPAIVQLYKDAYADLGALRSRVAPDAKVAPRVLAVQKPGVKKAGGTVKARLAPAAESWPEVFVSYRVREADMEAKLLKAALEASGVRTYVCTTALENGIDWGTNVSNHLGHCRMMVIMGTPTYGAPGTEVMGTWEELQYALRHHLPLYIIKMTGDKGYTEERTKVMLEPRQVELSGWAAGAAAPQTVVDGILSKIASLRKAAEEQA